MLLSSSRYEELNQEVRDLLETYGIVNYPLDVFALVERMGIRLIPYTSILHMEHFDLARVSKDAFTIAVGNYEVNKTCICYNPDALPDRLRQSIAHEVAHIWLEHPNSEEPFETEAEYFAAYLLAPIPLIIKHELSSLNAIREAFQTSYTAARISAERASNRQRCGKPAYGYEYRIIEMCSIERGDCLESA